MPDLSLTSVLIKPAGPDCNLACAYCFYLKKSALFEEGRHRMSEAILRESMRQVMHQGGAQVNIGWQGGEPTLMGRTFFEKAVHYQNRCSRPGQQAANALQTNGLLIDLNWAAFLREHQFLVGLSLDGPAHIHDRYRTFSGGRPSWERVAAARDLLLQAGVAVNALIVVNDYSIQFAREMYEYHKKNGLVHMQFISCLEPDPLHPGRWAAYSADADAYGRFLIELFDLWRADFRHGQPTTFIRWFDSLFFTYVGLDAPECTLLPACGVYVVIEHDGSVYSCDFYVDEAHRLGNVLDGKLQDMLNSKVQKQFGADKGHLPESCTSCPWLTHCHGGCPRERIFSSDGVNALCASWKQFFEYADPWFSRLAAEWLAKNRIP